MALKFRSFDATNLRQRTLSALLIAPLALLAVWSGGIAYFATVTLMALLGLREWLRLADPMMPVGVKLVSYAALLITVFSAVRSSIALGILIGAASTLLVFLIAVRSHRERAGWIAFGIPYMGGAGLALLDLRMMSDSGAQLVCYLLFTVWSTDIGAYLSGRALGGPKLVPDISPNKTWAGLFGGMVLAALIGYAAAHGFGAKKPSVALGLAILLAVVSQLGDVFESWCKRRSGVKESGGLIPGHGGILDRIDGLVFAAVFFVMFQAALGAPMNWW